MEEEIKPAKFKRLKQPKMTVEDCGEKLMTLQELQNQALQLPIRDRWQLVQALLESLKREAALEPKRKNLSRLRGIAKTSGATGEEHSQDDYTTYLTEKYQ